MVSKFDLVIAKKIKKNKSAGILTVMEQKNLNNDPREPG